MTTLLIQIISDALLETKKLKDETLPSKVVMLSVDDDSDVYVRIRNAIALKMFALGNEEEPIDAETALDRLPNEILASAQKLIERHLHVIRVGVSATDSSFSMETIVRQIKRDESENRFVVKSICLDNLDCFCRQTTAPQTGTDPHHILLAKKIKQSLFDLKNLAESLSCPVWFTHHRKGKLGKEPPTRKPRLTDAIDLSFLHEHVDSMFSLGNLSASSCLRLDQLKPRRADERSLVVEHFGGIVLAQVSEDARRRFYSGKREEEYVLLDQKSRETLEELVSRREELRRCQPKHRIRSRRIFGNGRPK
jgi:hypothetical protein